MTEPHPEIARAARKVATAVQRAFARANADLAEWMAKRAARSTHHHILGE